MGNPLQLVGGSAGSEHGKVQQQEEFEKLPPLQYSLASEVAACAVLRREAQRLPDQVGSGVS